MPPGTVMPVVFISNLSMDRHKASYFLEEQVVGDPLDGVVVPEGTYPALGQHVKVLVANNGPDMQNLPVGQKLEGYVVSETKGTTRTPAQGAQLATAQEIGPEEATPEISESEN